MFNTNQSVAEEASKLYRSFDADFEAEISVVPYGKVDHYLIRFIGFEHAYDDKVALYEKKWVNKDKRSGYYYQMAGTRSFHVRNDEKTTLISGTIYPYLEVFLEDKSPTKIVYSDEVDVAIERNIKKQYLQQQGLVKSKVEAKRLVSQATQELWKQCQKQIDIQIDWQDFNGPESKTTPGMLKFYLGALSKLCREDSDYTMAIKMISAIKVSASIDSQLHSVSLVNSELVIKLDRDTPNIEENSYQAIVNAI